MKEFLSELFDLCFDTPEEIEESIASSSIIKLDRKRKLRMLRGALAIKICQKENPSLYKKFKTARDKYLALRKQIIMKYGTKAAQRARKAASSK